MHDDPNDGPTPDTRALPHQPAPGGARPTEKPAARTPGDHPLAALRRIAADDAGDISNLEGQWVPHLSSKVKGTSDDGIVNDYRAILAEHLRLRARYPDARLVNSSEYKSFLVPGYWVTVVAQPTARWQPALRWCPTNGFDTDHCYANQLLHEGPTDGSTHYLADLATQATQP